MYYYDDEAGNIWVVMFFFSLLLNLIVAFMMQNAAKKKGYDDSTPERTSHAILICVFLGIFGILYIMSLPDLVLRDKLDMLIGNGGSSNGMPNNSNQSTQAQKRVIADDLPEL